VRHKVRQVKALALGQQLLGTDHDIAKQATRANSRDPLLNDEVLG